MKERSRTCWRCNHLKYRQRTNKFKCLATNTEVKREELQERTCENYENYLWVKYQKNT